MTEIIQNYGLRWKAQDVFWGTSGNAGALLGRSTGARRETPVDFRDQAGIYILYNSDRLVYVGQSGSGNRFLLNRLLGHLRRDRLTGRWDSFSWFGLRRVLRNGELAKLNRRMRSPLATTLNHMEAVLIAGADPPLNLQGGRFGGSAKRYVQVRDERLGPTDAQMIRSVWEELNSEA